MVNDLMLLGRVRLPGNLVELLEPIRDLSQHPENPNSGDVELIAESILTYGFTSPVIVQASTNYIVAGNHRYAAMLALGQDEIPVVRVEMTDEEALGYMLMDNRTSEVAVRDEFLVTNILEKLTQRPQGLAATGYNLKDLATIKSAIRYNEAAPLNAVRGMRPVVMVTGYLEDDGSVTPLTFGDIGDIVVRLADYGFKAKGVDHD